MPYLFVCFTGSRENPAVCPGRPYQGQADISGISKNPLCSDETWPNLSDKVAIDKIHNWVWWIGWWAYICSFYFTDTCIQIWNRILKMWWTRRRWTRTRWTLGKTSAEKKTFKFRHCLKGGKGYPCPNFLHRFLLSKVSKKGNTRMTAGQSW